MFNSLDSQEWNKSKFEYKVPYKSVFRIANLFRIIQKQNILLFQIFSIRQIGASFHKTEFILYTDRLCPDKIFATHIPLFNTETFELK